MDVSFEKSLEICHNNGRFFLMYLYGLIANQ